MTRDCSCHGADKGLAATSIGLLERPRYSPGLILEDSDLTAAVDYTRELNRLLFRSLFGCGVVCGLEVSLGNDCGLQVMVAPGLALDGCGDPLQLTGPVTVALGRREGVLPAPGTDGPPERVRDLWVIACAREKHCAPRALVCDADDLDGTRQPTRTRATTEISVSLNPPQCVCGCKPFDEAEDSRELGARANRLLPVRDQGADDAAPGNPCGVDEHGCHEAHYTDPKCPADCGCGSACACGCCVLLAWVHWFEREQAWGVLHEGVRRFIRPCLIDDPIRDQRPQRPATETTDTVRDPD